MTYISLVTIRVRGSMPRQNSSLQFGQNWHSLIFRQRRATNAEYIIIDSSEGRKHSIFDKNYTKGQSLDCCILIGNTVIGNANMLYSNILKSGSSPAGIHIPVNNNFSYELQQMHVIYL